MKKMYRLLLLCCMLSLAGCTVSDKGVKITRIEFAEPNKTISVHEEYVLDIRHFPETAPAPDYNIWTENNAVAVVSNGKVKGVGTGITTIFAGANVNNTDLLAIGTITVTDLIPSEIRFTPSEISIHVGASKRPDYSVVPANSTLIDLVWSSSDDAVAVVDGEGIVMAKSIGETIITAKVRGTNVTDVCKVNVTPAPVTGLRLSVDGVEPAEFIRVPVLLGNTLIISPVVYPEYAGNKAVTFESSDNSIAHVEYANNAFYVVTNKIGVADITAKTVDGGYTATCEVAVCGIDRFAHLLLHVGTEGNSITGFYSYIYAQFNLEINSPVYINELAIRNANGGYAYLVSDVGSCGFYTTNKVVTAQGLQTYPAHGWKAEMTFTWHEKEYRISYTMP